MDLGKAADSDGWVGLSSLFSTPAVTERGRVSTVVIEFLGVNVHCDEA